MANVKMPQECAFFRIGSVSTDCERRISNLVGVFRSFIRRRTMQSFKLIRNVVATSAALLAMIVPGVMAKAQTQPAPGVKTVLLVHGAWADGSSWAKVIPILEAKGLQGVA